MTDLRKPPASVGPPPQKGQDKLTDRITDLTEGVRGGMQQMKELHRTSAVGMRAIMDEEDKLKSELVSAAFIAHGQGPAPDQAQRVTSQNGASITLKPPPTGEDDKSSRLQAALVQAVTAILSISFTVIFVYVLKVDIPTEVAVLIPILGQSLATILNNFVIGKSA